MRTRSIELLQGFLDYTTTRGSTHHNDTALFYDQSKLQLDFNYNSVNNKDTKFGF